MTPLDRPSPPILGAAVSHKWWPGWLIETRVRIGGAGDVYRSEWKRDQARCRVCGRREDAHR